LRGYLPVGDGDFLLTLDEKMYNVLSLQQKLILEIDLLKGQLVLDPVFFETKLQNMLDQAKRSAELMKEIRTEINLRMSLRIRPAALP
jgi:hypothetical protein